MPAPGGYPDWQRVEAWDGPVLWQTAVANQVTSIDSGILDVSRFAYIGGLVDCTGGGCYINALWYMDSAGANPVAYRRIVLDHTVQDSQMLQLINLGPFVRLTVNKIGANFTFNATMFGNNRAHPLEWIPGRVPLLNFTSGLIANGASVVMVPYSYYAGPILVEFFPSGATWVCDLYVRDDTGNDALVNRIEASAAVSISHPMIVPSGYWYLKVVNLTGANATADVKAVASQTGSS